MNSILRRHICAHHQLSGCHAAAKLLAIGFFFGLSVAIAQAKTISVPNGSFESPQTSFVTLQVDSWEKTLKDQPGGQFDQLVGIFKNTTNGAADHIDNMDGEQAVYIFAVPGVGI